MDVCPTNVCDSNSKELKPYEAIVLIGFFSLFRAHVCNEWIVGYSNGDNPRLNLIYYKLGFVFSKLELHVAGNPVYTYN